MNLLLFTIIFIILSLAHPIADFKRPNRRFGFKSISELKSLKGWKLFLTSEFVLSLNPIHAIIDSSKLRKHGEYSEIFIRNDEIMNRLKYKENPTKLDDARTLQLLDPSKFWKHLGNDQFYHVIANIILSYAISLFF